ncbi:MAG: hypothetical protein KAT58_08975 [candidate division Zixibacteria bacterium]|nr:hypothetical protein [candidate division Zixibacteria bacterium]
MRVAILLVACLLITVLTATTIGGDLLDEALSLVGKSRADLGYHPKGYWNRYPYQIPYKLPAFDDLFAEPLKVYDYSYSMKAAVEHYLADSAFWAPGNSALYQLSYHLAWERKVGGFRNYSANLIDSIESETPLLTVIEQIYLKSGVDLEYRTFGNKADWPNLKEKLDTLIRNLDPRIEMVLAVWLANLLDAHKYHEFAFRNVPLRIIHELHQIDDLDATQGDGQKYYPQFDDCARLLDWQSLVYASFKTIAATDIAAKKLSRLVEKGRDISFDFDTPLGSIVINGAGDDQVAAQDYLLVCDFGGNDHYLAGGGSSATQPLSVLVDLSGDDIYGDENSARRFGCGICGIGVCLDLSGNDKYIADRLSFGVGIFGTGLLADFAGRDDYRMCVSGQGCGYFGVGMLFDVAGDDHYYLAGDGQGAGGIGGGIGILADYAGNDNYTAEPFADVFNRGDYHSGHKINANSAQGWGGGRRGDGADGHSWAGGLGVLIDCFGDDEYYSGNFSLGCGYWFGIGIVFDVNGNDFYRSCYFTQASGAHFCIGAIFDETGDDRHELFETAGAGLSFGWDFSVNFLIDWEGNDIYSAKIISIALSDIRSNAFLFDFGGDDLYQLRAGTAGMGEADFRESYRTQPPITPFPSYAQSYGILIDVGGVDQYLDYVDSTRSTQPRAGCGNNTIWLRPARGHEHFGYNNYGIGIDCDSGQVDDFFVHQKNKQE